MPQSELACARAHVRTRLHVHSLSVLTHVCVHTRHTSSRAHTLTPWLPLLNLLAFLSPAPVPGLLPRSVTSAALCSPPLSPTSMRTRFKMPQTDLDFHPLPPQCVVPGLSHFGKWDSFPSTSTPQLRPMDPLSCPRDPGTSSHPHVDGHRLPASPQPLHTPSPLTSQDDLQTSWAPRMEPNPLTQPSGPRTQPERESETSLFSQLPVISILCPPPATSPLP